jgi:hypothetical protein
MTAMFCTYQLRSFLILQFIIPKERKQTRIREERPSVMHKAIRAQGVRVFLLRQYLHVHYDHQARFHGSLNKRFHVGLYANLQQKKRE